MSKKGKKRADKLLVERGLAESPEKARAIIMAGKVLVNGVVVDKPGTEVKEDAEIVLREDVQFVSRGGLKLESALDNFAIKVTGKIVIDIGASTGGFTDCLLTRGATKVFAVDVGKGLLDWRLRGDERVVVREGRNIRYLTYNEVGEKLDIAVIDVSFISLEKVIPKVKEFLKPGGLILALIKPQFEVKREEVEHKGVIKDPQKHALVIERIKAFSEQSGFMVKGIHESPVRGAKGNKEFWIYLQWAAETLS